MSTWDFKSHLAIAMGITIERSYFQEPLDWRAFHELESYGVISGTTSTATITAT